MPGELHKRVGFALFCHTVDASQIPYVTQAGTAHSGFQPTDLGGRAQHLLADIFDGQPELAPEVPQSHAQFTLADGRVGIVRDCRPS